MLLLLLLVAADAVADSPSDLPGRHKAVVDSIYEDEEEADEEFSQTVLREAAAMRGNHLDEEDRARDEDDERDLFDDEPRLKSYKEGTKGLMMMTTTTMRGATATVRKKPRKWRSRANPK